MDTQIIAGKKIVVFVSQSSYEPAQQLITLLQAANQLGSVIQLEEIESDRDNFKDTYTVVMFVTPTDFPKVIYLTNALVKIAQQEQISNLVWVAPIAEKSSGLEQGLTQAAEIVNKSPVNTLILRHAPVFSDLLQFKKEIKFRRTLSLPLKNNSLPWIAPEDLAEGIFRWVTGINTSRPPKVITGKSQLNGSDLAQEISTVLERNLNGLGFAIRCFKAIDTDNSKTLDREEMFIYLEQLAYTRQEAEVLIEQADTNQDGSIDFEEFIAGLAKHLDKILADLPHQVQYVNVLPSTVLYDLRTKGIAEKTVQAWLALITSFEGGGLEINQSSAEWLGRGSTSLSTWLEKHVLDFINVYILPSKGILTINEGILDGKPALTTRILQSDDRLLVGVRTLDNRTVEWKWENSDLSKAESVQYQTDQGGQRVLKFKDDQLVGMSVQGTWLGRRLANDLLFQQKSLPRWQINLFRELGELQIEEVSNLTDPESIVCNCTQTTCGQLQDMIAGGLDTIEKLAEATQITLICGGCLPLVEEMLGSANLDVAEMLLKQRLTKDIFRFQFCPVREPVVTYQPGQHIVIQGRVDGIWVTRAYTLSSSADQNKRYEITVKREEMGVFSRWLCDRANENSLFRISQPRGEFILEAEPIVYFFAGGIGVTPAISMIRTLVSTKAQRYFCLDWSAPQPEDFVFKKELDFLCQKLPNFKVNYHSTRTQGRLTAEQVKKYYSYQEGAVAFLCGPQSYMDAVRSYLLEAGWAESSIRQELFSSRLDEEGNAESLSKRPAIEMAGGIKTIESYSFDIQPIGEMAKEAEAYLKQCYLERGLPEVFLPRWREVEKAIAETGTYEHTLDELSYGARLAWRNSSRCVGRYFWQNLQIRDLRHLETEEEMFAALVEHIKIATNNGDLRALMTAFKPDGRRLWNSQLLRYAGYQQEDGILGDPANVELTQQALKLGWQPPANRTAFDYLPLIIQLPGKTPKWFEIPPEIILDVAIAHPRYEWFKELGLKWYALPAVCNMSLDLGGIQYSCTPFNGFYMGTEIGGRNFSDTYRYNMLPEIGDRLGLDCSSNDTLWRDQALIELNIAVLHSFKQQGVRLIDHHTMTDYFMQFMEEEQKCQRPVLGDWGWIVPPISGSLTPVYPLELENRILKPNYFYQPDPWQTDDQTQNLCPFHKK
jgi:nitric-oxide synthase, bacterial